LAILTVLLAVGIGTRAMLQNDYRVLGNLRVGTEAFYIANAGIEWAKNEIGRTLAMPPAPADRVVSFRSGNFSVAFSSPAQVGPIAASLVVRSVGTLGPSSHMLQAQLTKTYDLTDAALTIRGNVRQTVFGSSPVVISGADYDPNAHSVATGAKPRPAITTADESLRALVQNTLDSASQTVLDGANPSLTTSGYLPSAAASQLVNQLCASAAAIVTMIPVGGSVSFVNQNWGTPAAPELRCFEGLSVTGDDVTLADNIVGAGILIVRNADLVMAGVVQWQGLIIVTGSEVGLRVSGAANKEIFGGILLNETGSPMSAKAILEIHGNFGLRFSRKALARSATLVPTAALVQATPVLPFVITQNYWRTVNP
jgi:hypothetical protein